MKQLELLDKKGLSYLWEKISKYISDIEIKTPKMYSNTKSNWDKDISIISEPNSIYIYTDYMHKDGKDIAGIKIGDGKAYLIDIPFIDTIYLDHIDDTSVHVTDEEREFWNNKVRCYYSSIEGDTIIFTND